MTETEYNFIQSMRGAKVFLSLLNDQSDRTLLQGVTPGGNSLFHVYILNNEFHIYLYNYKDKEVRPLTIYSGDGFFPEEFDLGTIKADTADYEFCLMLAGMGLELNIGKWSGESDNSLAIKGPTYRKSETARAMQEVMAIG